MATIAGIEVGDLNAEQKHGKRCAVCNTDWYVRGLTGVGISIDKVPVPNSSLVICRSHEEAVRCTILGRLDPPPNPLTQER